MSETLNEDMILQTTNQVNAILQEAGTSARTGRTRAGLGHTSPDVIVTSLIDHTQLAPDTMARQVEMLCFEAKEHGFASVCVNSWYVPLAAELLKENDVTLCTVVGYPSGASLPQVTAFAAQEAIKAGAREIDMSIHIGALKSRDIVGVFEDVSDVAAVCHDADEDVLCKVIIETALLTETEIIIACQIAKESGADFVVTGTRYDAAIAVEHLKLMRQVIGDGIGIKAVGRIDSLDSAITLRDAGANRLGTTQGVLIAQEQLSS